jgi:Mn-dependent DtxR family transcriptional regulator
MASNEIDRSPVLASNLKARLGKTTFEKLLRKTKCTDGEIEDLLKRIYSLWHELGTYYSLAKELEISPPKVTLLMNFIKEYKIIRNFHVPRRILTEEQKEKIFEAKKLYDELLNLSLVSKQLGITRERVRQILEKGNDYGIIEYKPPYLKRFDEIAKRFNKKDLEDMFVELGSIKKLIPYMKNELDIKLTEEQCRHVFKIYNIDCDYLSLQHRKKRCYLEYNEMIQELGFHPTTTIMSKRPKWRALWSRTSKLWGCMDNFRKEFGIPIPQKGSPTFKEDMLEGRQERLKELRRIKSEKIQALLEYINTNSPVSRKQIEHALHLKKATVEIYMKELIDKNKVDWMWDGKRYQYFRKS